MKVIYIADDGKQFNDENECMEYEFQKLYEKGESIISGFGPDDNWISFSEAHFCREATIISLKTEEAVKLFIRRCTEENLSNEGIDKPGIYIWGDSKYAYCENYQWTNATEVLEDYENLLNGLKNLINSF